MDTHEKNYLRVQNCIGTIIDVQKSVASQYPNEDLLGQFHELEEALENLDMTLVSEKEVRMVERATNALLKEFRSLFEAGKLGPVYENLKS